MPIYATRCTKCGNEDDLILSMKSDLPACSAVAGHSIPEGDEPPVPFRCGGKLEKIPARTAAHFKGGGWTPRLTGGRTE